MRSTLFVNLATETTLSGLSEATYLSTLTHHLGKSSRLRTENKISYWTLMHEPQCSSKHQQL